MADLHIGSWRDPKLRNASTVAFEKAIDECVLEKVDFILFSGDLFNTTLPGIDNLKRVVKKLKSLVEFKIPVYVVPGSHDYSPSGKTMIDVLEEAGLLINVFKGSISGKKLSLKFIKDDSGALITGIIGKKGMLDQEYYDNLEVVNEEGFKIFLFHTAVKELLPKSLDMIKSISVNDFPAGFDYYAGGHIHTVKIYDNFVYPGPLFPNSFSEVEKFGKGGFFIYDNGNMKRKDIELYPHRGLVLDCSGLTPEDIYLKIEEWNPNFNNALVTLRLTGVINGRVIDIPFKKIFDKIYSSGAYFIMRNTNKLSSENLENLETEETSIEEIEKEVFKDYENKELALKLMDSLSGEKNEGERVYEYEDRIKKDVMTILNLLRKN